MRIPQSLEILKEFLTDEEIMIFAEYHSGQTVYIPKKLKTDHPLLKFNKEIATKLASRYAGITFSVPKLSRLKELRRNETIRQYRKIGWTVSSISQYFDLSARQIFLILSRDYAQN